MQKMRSGVERFGGKTATLDPERETRDAGSESSASHPPADQEADDHIGATDDEVDPVPAPAGDAFNDEPRQG